MSLPIDETHDPARSSWVATADGHPDFPIQNLPFGVFDPGDGDRRIGVAIGDFVLDLRAVAQAGLLFPHRHPGESRDPDTQRTGSSHDVAFLDSDFRRNDDWVLGTTLNALFARPALERGTLRRRLSTVLSDPAYCDLITPMLYDAADIVMHLPAAIGDYTDFYVGIHHANNVGRQFRPDNPLLPNYKYVPIGYHGRASSIRPSGVPVRRPNGQRKAPDAEVPSFGPTRRLDYELELGLWVGPGNELGQPIPIGEAESHIVGFCLLNDWSARDVQGWEYQPLGPFLAKNFQSTISSWVITAEALAPFRVAQPVRPEGDPRPLPYLWDDADQAKGALAIDLEVSILTAKMREAGTAPFRLSHGPATSMYWTAAQIVTHHASNGCNLNPGDLIGTGTLSAPTEDGFGSLMELSRGGTLPLTLPDGETRSFAEDGDEIILSATASADGYVSIGFGECRAAVLPAV